MSIINSIRKWRKDQERERENRRLRRIRALVAEMRAEKNNGRLRHLLFTFPGVNRVDVASGGFKMAHCDVWLDSGHEFTGSGLFAIEAIRNCAAKVAMHLRQRGK